MTPFKNLNTFILTAYPYKIYIYVQIKTAFSFHYGYTRSHLHFQSSFRVGKARDFFAICDVMPIVHALNNFPSFALRLSRSLKTCIELSGIYDERIKSPAAFTIFGHNIFNTLLPWEAIYTHLMMSSLISKIIIIRLVIS